MRGHIRWNIKLLLLLTVGNAVASFHYFSINDFESAMYHIMVAMWTSYLAIELHKGDPG